MSNIIDRISDAYDKAKDFVQEHPWQAAAVLAGGPIVGPVMFAGAVAAEEAAKRALPVITLSEAAAVGAGVLAATGGALGAVEGAAIIAAGPAAGKAIESAVKAAGEAISKPAPCPEKH